MSTINFFSSNINSIQQGSSFLDRPRLHKLLEEAVNYPIVAIYAGAGYGKTRTLSNFLLEYDAYTTWIQLSERDNVLTRFWERYTHVISLNWPDVANSLQEVGFPETEEAFAKYVELRDKTLDYPSKFLLVYDDFHLIHNADLLKFFEKSANTLPDNGTVILLSRTIPEINLTGMLLRERVFTIREDALCFTEDEISHYFNQLGLYLSKQDIRCIYEDTRGWAFAINLIGRSLMKDIRYERNALDAMKTNIFKLIETEITQYISEPLWRFLLRISLVENHTSSLIKSLTDDEALIDEMEHLNAYIRYDHFLGTYMIHHLFLEYLRQFQCSLTLEEKRETYQKTGQWCEKNDYLVDAMSYYEKSGDWDAVLNIVFDWDFPLPMDLAKYALEILQNTTDEICSSNELYPAIILKLKMSLGLLEEASEVAVKFVEKYETLPESTEKHNALSNIFGTWAVLQMMKCSQTDVYDFDIYFEKQREYFEKDHSDTLGFATNFMVGSYALMIGSNRYGAPEEFISALTRAVPNASFVQDGNLYGLDDLARGELLYFQRDLSAAEQYLKQSLDKARIKQQFDIQNRSLLYLMCIAFARADMKAADSLLSQLEALLDEKDYRSRYEAYDIAKAFYHMALGQAEEIADWLKGDFSHSAHPVFLENHANRLKAQYHYMTMRYNEVLAFVENTRGSQTLLLERILFKVLEALSLYQLKRKEEAIAALTEAYHCAAPNNIIVPFTQFAKDMRTLTAAAIKYPNCSIPVEWLENINRKSSAFARRKAHFVSENKANNGNGNNITLTKREAEILKDLAQGLSRTEIAASQNISINTVKMNINIIYEKLHANNLVNAVRIASERKII
ncbi:MAG: LuxR C-terminal-related transcriptional regulator [Oscillospiraceae bacterium]|nr:LuxR C-terminal-related transcriptional regulator [Oscillospiraceae bacterium]